MSGVASVPESARDFVRGKRPAWFPLPTRSANKPGNRSGIDGSAGQCLEGSGAAGEEMAAAVAGGHVLLTWDAVASLLRG